MGAPLSIPVEALVDTDPSVVKPKLQAKPGKGSVLWYVFDQ